MDIQQITNLILKCSPPEMGEPQNPTVLQDLSTLTGDLIAAYRKSGLLQHDPFAESRQRTIRLHESAIREVLQDRIVLVTGGSGCIGSLLISRLTRLGVRRVISVDRVRPDNEIGFTHHHADLFDLLLLRQIFAKEKPQIVFHLGAQRDPGLAEFQMRDTVRSNIVATNNVIQVCQENGVTHCVYSSTGKASRYLTSEIYAASKKLSEWQIMQASRESQTNFSAVRFTHVLDRSLVCTQIDQRVAERRPIYLHGPHRYVIAQNGHESVQLLLNSLIFSQPGDPRITLVRNLGWPVETLEYALFRIRESGVTLPIYFQGIPTGYEEGFFAGQVSWDRMSDINPLINVLEDPTRTIDDTGDTLVIRPAPFDAEILGKHIATLSGYAADLAVSDRVLKWSVAQAVREIAGSSMRAAPLSRVLQILRWGTDKKRLSKYGDSLQNHREMISFLGESIQNRRDEQLELSLGFQPGEVDALLQI